MRRNPLTLVAVVVATIALVGAAKYFLTAGKCKDQIVTLTLPGIKLPYKTEEGASLSVDGISRGRFEIPATGDITQIELSAIMLDPEQNLIRQVLMIGGNFPENATFEFSDRFKHNPIKPAKLIEHIVLQPTGSNTNFIYLFAPPQLGRWNATRIVTVELDGSIPLSQLAVRQAGTPAGKWVEGRFTPTNEKIRAKYAHRNETTKEFKQTYVYGAPSDCPQE